jgi:fructoselysine 6-kinase
VNRPVRIAGVGDNVVDCYADAGMMFPGGNTLNVAVHAARHGANSAYFGQIAHDPAGETIARALRAEGVDVSRLRHAPGSTAHCIIEHDEHGDRTFASFDLGVSRFDLTDQDISALRGFDAAHVGATSGLDPALPSIAGATRLSYDFSTYGTPEHIAAVGARSYLAIHSGGDLGEDEFERLIQRSEASGARWSLVTRGTLGAVLAHRGQRWIGQAAPSVDAVDTLGAGDTFAARVLVGLLHDERPDHLLAEAAEAAARTCSHLGAFGHGAHLTLDTPALPEAG